MDATNINGPAQDPSELYDLIVSVEEITGQDKATTAAHDMLLLKLMTELHQP